MITPRPFDPFKPKELQLQLEKKWEVIGKDFAIEKVDKQTPALENEASGRIEKVGKQIENEASEADKKKENEASGTDQIVKLVCMSDTHSTQREFRFSIPDGDIFIHAGDFTRYGLPSEIVAFNNWLATLPHRHKVVVSGNHELSLDPSTWEEAAEYMDQAGETRQSTEQVRSLLTNCIYLEDEIIEVMGLKIFGSPWQPDFSQSAFCLQRGESLRKKWSKIPEDTEVLVTHGPPLGVGDLCSGGGGRAGCQDLLEQVTKVVKPKLHVFGHIHEGYGMYKNGKTTFVNAATVGPGYKPINPPVVFNFKKS